MSARLSFAAAAAYEEVFHNWGFSQERVLADSLRALAELGHRPMATETRWRSESPTDCPASHAHVR